jgi:hypothetical protein
MYETTDKNEVLKLAAKGLHPYAVVNGTHSRYHRADVAKAFPPSAPQDTAPGAGDGKRKK